MFSSFPDDLHRSPPSFLGGLKADFHHSRSAIPASPHHTGSEAQLRMSDQLWQAVTSMRALSVTLGQSTVSPSSPCSGFDSALRAAVRTARATLETVVIDALHTPAASHLRACWTANMHQRELVHALTSESRADARKQQDGLQQIKACLTAQLAKQVGLLKSRVQEHKVTTSIQQSIGSSPVSSPPRRTSKSSTPASPSTGNSVLPSAVVQLHERCVAIHRDIQVIDSQLEAIRVKLDRIDGWTKVEARHPSPYKSPAAVIQLASQPPSSASSKFSTPGSYFMSATPASSGSSSVSSTSSHSSFSHASTPSRPPSADHADGGRSMQQLLFSPILPASSGASPVSDHDGTPSSSSSSRDHRLEVSALDTLFSKIWSGSPSAKECAAAATAASAGDDANELPPTAPFFIFVTPAAEEEADSAAAAAPVTPLRKTTPSSTRSHKQRRHRGSVPSSPPTAAGVSTPNRPSVPAAAHSSPAHARQQATGAWYLERAREIAENMHQTSEQAHAAHERQATEEAHSPPAAPTTVQPLTPSALISMAASSPFAPIDASADADSNASTSISSNSINGSSNVELSHRSLASSPGVVSKHAGLASTDMEGVSEQLLRELDTPFEKTVGTRPADQTATGRAQAQRHGVVCEEAQDAADDDQPQSDLAILLRTQEAKHARHAWMREMARQNADVDKLYDDVTTATTNADEEEEEEEVTAAATEAEETSAAVLRPLATPPRTPVRSSHATPPSARHASNSSSATKKPRPSVAALLERSFGVGSPSKARTPQKRRDHQEEEETAEAPSAHTPVAVVATGTLTPSHSARPSSVGWSQSFHMGDNLQLKQLVTSLQAFGRSTLLSAATPATPNGHTHTSVALSSVASPSPYKSSASELLRKVQLMNAQMREEQAAAVVVPAMAVAPPEPNELTPPSVDHEPTPTVEREWFEVSAAMAAPESKRAFLPAATASSHRSPLRDVTNHPPAFLSSIAIEFDDADFIESSGRRLDSDDDNAASSSRTTSASKPSTTMQGSPVRYSVFTPTVFIKRVVAVDPSAAAAADSVVEGENIQPATDVAAMAKAVLARLPVAAPSIRSHSSTSAVKAHPPLKHPRAPPTNTAVGGSSSARQKLAAGNARATSSSKKKSTVVTKSTMSAPKLQ